MTTQWELFEDYLTVQGLTAFDSRTVAQDLQVTGPEASSLIQSYLEAQRRPTGLTLYVLHRTGRTRSAIWHVGNRTDDMRELSRQYAEDMMVRFQQMLAPDLIRMGDLNPRAAKVADAIINVVEANLALLATGL